MEVLYIGMHGGTVHVLYIGMHGGTVHAGIAYMYIMSKAESIKTENCVYTIRNGPLTLRLR